MNADLHLLAENAIDIYREMRTAADKAVFDGFYLLAANLYRVAGAAARIAAEKDREAEDYFYEKSIECDSSAYYYESLPSFEEV